MRPSGGVGSCLSRPAKSNRCKSLASIRCKLDTGIAEALRSGDQKRAKDCEDNGPRLSIFGERDHGALLQIAGSSRNAMQYEVGNPLTASMMTRHLLPAALYAPLRGGSVRGRAREGNL